MTRDAQSRYTAIRPRPEDPADDAADLLAELRERPYGEALATLRAALLAAQFEGAAEVRRSFRARMARALL